MGWADWERDKTILLRIRDLLFRDTIGTALFLGTIIALALLWRVDFFIMDSYAIANTLVNVGEGHLTIEHIRYSLTLGSQPGLHVHDGHVYGRNYGQVFFALGLYWLLEGISLLVDVRMALVGAWGLLVIAFGRQLGIGLGRPRTGAILGSLLGGGLFVWNVLVMSRLDSRWTALLAVQLVTILAAGVVAVALYRLLTLMSDREVGVLFGAFTPIGTALGFWGPIPKRHVITAAFLLVSVLAFAHSRTASTDRSRLAARSGAYVAIGLLAWVHAAEGLVLLVVLAPIDLLTARSNAPRELITVGAAFGLSLVPFLLTNFLIAGNPFVPPRLLSAYEGDVALGPGGAIGSLCPTTEAVTAAAGAGIGVSVLPQLPAALAILRNQLLLPMMVGFRPLRAGVLTIEQAAGTLIRVVRLFLSYLLEGGRIVLGEPERVFHVFVRSGRVPGVEYAHNSQEAIELSMIESSPILVLVTIAPLVAARRLRTRSRPISPRRLIAGVTASPARQTDLFVVGLIVVFTFLYLPRLPLYSQITVRYLLPTVPLWLYLIGRLEPIRRLVRDQYRWIVITYVGSVLVGSGGVVLALLMIDPALGEAMQFLGLVNLASAVVGVVFVGIYRRNWLSPRLGALGITAPAASTTIFLFVTGIEIFQYGQYVFPITRQVSNIIPLF